MLTTIRFCLLSTSCAIVLACSNSEDQSLLLPPDVYDPPLYNSLNTSQGYLNHPIKGDSIEPLLTPDRDTLITGVPITLEGKPYSFPELQKESVIASTPRAIELRNQTDKASDVVRIVPLDIQNVKSFVPSNDSSTNTNLSGLTGKISYASIPARFVEVSTIKPNPITSSLPEFKDSYSQNIRYLDVDQGMNSSRIHTMLQDKRGNLWFGTHGGGVTKYDGERFSFYTTDHGLNANIVTSMYEDSQGNIWFGTWGEGISLFNGEIFLDLSANDLIEGRINSIWEDGQGQVWIGSEDGIFKYDDHELTRFSNLEGRTLRITTIIQDRTGMLWFGTMNQGILSYDGNEFTRYPVSEGMNSNAILALLEDEQGNLWMGTGDQELCVFDGDQFIYYNVQFGSSNKAINAVQKDSLGNIWIATDGDGLVKFDGNSFTRITMREGLSDNNILSILQDRNAQIWAGTNDGGVSVLKNNSFLHLVALESINASHVRSIREDDQGNYWFATWGGGVIMKKGNRLFQYTTEHGLPGNTIWDMLIDKQGYKWFGGDGGLTSFDGRQFVNYPMESHVYSLLQDRSGTIWIGTNGTGLVSYDGEKFVQYSTAEGFNGDKIWSMIEDKQGNLWIATFGGGGGGVAKFDGAHFTFYTEREGLIHNDIWSVFEDRRGNIWFGSYGEGIGIFDGNGFINITKSQGLPNNIINSIIEDPHGNIWVGTENGLSKLEMNHDAILVTDSIDSMQKLPYKLTNYTSNDGLIAEDFNVHSVYLDSQDNIWWGTGKSLVRLDLTTPQEAYMPPQVSLEQIQIGGRFVDYSSASESTQGKVNYGQIPLFTNVPEDLEVPFQQNHLTFYFTANNTVAAHKNLYSYLMPGVDEQWSNPSTEAKADYRNLPVGKHKFLISTASQTMEWSQPLEYSFTVLPPWWQTWWAGAVYLILGIAGITGIIRWRTASIKQRQKELEQIVEERTSEVVAQQKRSDELLLNILPANVAKELKETGQIEPVHFEEVSILFADFKEFTNIVASIPSKKLVYELNDIFQSFDDIMENRGLEKIQTVGDAYVAAGGLPNPDPEHARNCVVAAGDMIDYLSKRNETSSIKWKIRIGIHSGPITAGVVGKKKFAYDVFGDTVNVAARVQSASDAGRINVSAYTHDLIKKYYTTEYRGKINAKGKGDLDMYFVVDQADQVEGKKTHHF